jgi:glutathione peroxidase
MRLNRERDDLSRYRGDVLLVVNAATACGYTPQFEGLEALYRAHRSRRVRRARLPGQRLRRAGAALGQRDCRVLRGDYGVTFPMFSKTTVTGARADPLFRRLTAAAGAQWSFNKYLVNGAGRSSRGSPHGSSRTLGSCGSGCRRCCDSVRIRQNACLVVDGRISSRLRADRASGRRWAG